MMLIKKTCVGFFLTMFASIACAHGYKVGDILIDHPWAYATPPGAKVGGVYMGLKGGAANDRLLRASSPVAGKVEIHTHENDKGMMRMRAIAHIDVEAKKSVDLKPGGLHIMLFDLKDPLAKGKRIPLSLEFEKAGKVELEVSVHARDAAAADEHAGHKH